MNFWRKAELCRISFIKNDKKRINAGKLVCNHSLSAFFNMSIFVLKQIFEAKWFFSCRFENFKICKIGIAYLKKTCIIKRKQE